MEQEKQQPIKEVPQEYRTVWTFPSTEQLPIQYLGRCIPEIPRYCLKRFTKPGDLVLDPFMGSGTAVGECMNLGRRAIGIDATDGAMKATRRRMETYYSANLDKFGFSDDATEKGLFPVLMKGDARKIPLKDEKIDFVFAHVPYWSVITYSKPEEKNENDLSRIWSLESFHKQLLKCFMEIYRVLKNETYCVVLVGDVRQSARKVPLGFTNLRLLLAAGFQFYDQIIKVTDNAISMRRPAVMKKAVEEDRSVTVHEYIIVVKKALKKSNDIGLKFLDDMN